MGKVAGRPGWIDVASWVGLVMDFFFLVRFGLTCGSILGWLASLVKWVRFERNVWFVGSVVQLRG